MGYGQQPTFCSYRLHHLALLKVLNTLIWNAPAGPHSSKGSASPWGWQPSEDDISSSSSSLDERMSHAMGAASAHGLWPRKGEGAEETDCACPESNTNTATLRSQHTRQKISVLPKDLFLCSVPAVNKHSWWKLCQRCCWKMLDQTPWSHFQIPLYSFLRKKKKGFICHLIITSMLIFTYCLA